MRALAVTAIEILHSLFSVLDTTFLLMAQDTKPRTGILDDFRLDIGKKLAEFIDGLSQKVVVVISADLSHVHPTDVTDPLYLPAPG
jgi:hypothetical protein